MICYTAELEIEPKYTDKSLKLHLNTQHKDRTAMSNAADPDNTLRKTLRVIGVLLFPEPELLSKTPASSQQKHDHHLLQQKQAFAFELSANKKMQSVLLAQLMDTRKRKTRKYWGSVCESILVCFV